MIKKLGLFFLLINSFAIHANEMESKTFKHTALSIGYTTATEEYKREIIKANQIEIMESQIETMNAEAINQYNESCSALSAEVFFNKKSFCLPVWNTTNTGNRFGQFNCKTTLTLNCIKN